MKVGLALDGLLCDTDAARRHWSTRLGQDFIMDESFWGSLEPYDDTREAIALIQNYGWELFVFAERPKAHSLVTRAWVRNNAGVTLDRDHLIIPAIKRYDCRLLGIDVFVDSNAAALENLKIETVVPVAPYHVDRDKGESLATTIEGIHASLCN